MTPSEQSTRAQLRERQDLRAQRRRTRRRIVWISVGSFVLLLVGCATVVGLAASKAFDVRDSLTEAIPIATGLPSKVAAQDPAAALAEAQKLKSLSQEAATETADPVWRIAESVPVVGGNFIAVRAAAEGLDDIADFVVEAAPALDIGAFAPKNGAIDLEAVRRLGGLVATGADTFASVRGSLEGLSSFGLLPQVSDAVEKLNSAVVSVDDSLAAVSPILDVLPAALGENGQRTYLLMFQGNSELRASGGNPAALALVTVTNGAIELTTQATSVQFANARPESITALDPETEALYSDIIGRWIPNMTATPDFPTTVDIMRAWWADEQLPPFDDVISTDPIALSYLLKATGPLTLLTGETLTSENAASLLLNEVYFKYGEGKDASAQDAFFAAAAAQVFTALAGGTGSPLALMDALKQASDESRLKLWSSNPEIEKLVTNSKLAGTLPSSNDDTTVAGVYFNDTTGAKTDYYADASISSSTDLCTATGAPTFTQSITFRNNITPQQAADLPYFITGPHFKAGMIVTDVVVYTPVGATIESWSVDGAASSELISSGNHLGRSAVRISIVTPPGTAATINVTMKGAEGTAADAYGKYDVWTTPMVRATPVTIDAPGC